MSSGRVDILKEFFEEDGSEFKEILKHIGVRWLSLERAVERLLRNWKQLKEYFLAQGIKHYS